MTQLWQVTKTFFIRDIKSRYASSMLGLIWIILFPLSLIAITTFVFSFIFGQENSQYPYLLHVIIGYIHWLYFSQTLNKIVAVLQQNAGLIKNHNFPLLSLPLGEFLSRSLDYVVGLVILLIASLILQQNLSLSSLAIFSLVLIMQIMLQFGLGLIFATLNVFVRDVQYLVGLLLQIWFYATPVIYTVEMLPENISRWLWLNPLTTIFSAYRDIFFNSELNLSSLKGVFVLSVLILVLGLLVFNKYKHKFAELI